MIVISNLHFKDINYYEKVGLMQKLFLKATITKDLSRQRKFTLGRRPRGSCKEEKKKRFFLLV
jgi:hypothetical protein